MSDRNFVDGDVPPWGVGNRIGCDVSALIVVPVHVERRSFDRSDTEREARARARDAVLFRRPTVGGHLRVVDRAAGRTADEALADGLGPDVFLERMFETEIAVAAHLGGVLRGAEGYGIDVSPSHHPDAFRIRAARSFRTLSGLDAYEAGDRIRWRPSVRVEVKVSFDGPWEAVMWTVSELRSALWECGPVLQTSEAVRLPSAECVRSRLTILSGVSAAS